MRKKVGLIGFVTLILGIYTNSFAENAPVYPVDFFANIIAQPSKGKFSQKLYLIKDNNFYIQMGLSYKNKFPEKLEFKNVKIENLPDDLKITDITLQTIFFTYRDTTPYGAIGFKGTNNKFYICSGQVNAPMASDKTPEENDKPVETLNVSNDCIISPQISNSGDKFKIYVDDKQNTYLEKNSGIYDKQYKLSWYSAKDKIWYPQSTIQNSINLESITAFYLDPYVKDKFLYLSDVNGNIYRNSLDNNKIVILPNKMKNTPFIKLNNFTPKSSKIISIRSNDLNIYTLRQQVDSKSMKSSFYIGVFSKNPQVSSYTDKFICKDGCEVKTFEVDPSGNVLLNMNSKNYFILGSELLGNPLNPQEIKFPQNYNLTTIFPVVKNPADINVKNKVDNDVYLVGEDGKIFKSDNSTKPPKTNPESKMPYIFKEINYKILN